MTEAAVRDEAISWIIRLRDAAPTDWEAFTSWLEADPAHGVAYDAATMADAVMAETVGQTALRERPAPESRVVAAANDNRPGFFRRPAGLAATLLFAPLAWPAYRALTPTYVVETALGEHRSITLDDGAVIDLNGGTKLTLSHRNPRMAKLDSGEARFRVTHNADAPFSVIVGGARVEDVGTIFNIAREGEQTEVAVAEGAVLFNPGREAVELKSGDSLRVAGTGGSPVVRRIDPAAVGGWTGGRLEFTGERLADIAPDLARALGSPVSVDPAIAGRAFTGTIVIDTKDGAAMTRIAALIGVSAERTQDGWRLTGR